jgi:subtilase family serine protease
MRKIFYALSVAVVAAATAVVVFAQGPPPDSKAWIHIPDSTIERFGDVGVRAHTNHLILVRSEGKSAPQTSTPRGRSPLSLWQIYVDASATTISGGSQAIAIVDAYHYATALNDFNVFSQQFGLPQSSVSNPIFQVVYATGKQPKANCGWAQEAALDIEWAHAMAPNAKIILVEAASSSFADLFYAVDQATTIVKNAGGGEVSMSWGGSEFSTEKNYDSHFPSSSSSSVVYFASSGDTGGVTIYPSVSPNVVAAGGTSVYGSGGNATESGWSGSGGGQSKYEGKPTYQNGVSLLYSSSKRGVPDISFDADPNTGVSVYDSTSCQGMSGWMVFGGTSVSAPSLAGLTNAAGHFFSSTGQLSNMYILWGGGTYTNYYDVKTGSARIYNALVGWDFVTGIGTPRGPIGM